MCVLVQYVSIAVYWEEGVAKFAPTNRNRRNRVQVWDKIIIMMPRIWITTPPSAVWSPKVALKSSFLLKPSTAIVPPASEASNPIRNHGPFKMPVPPRNTDRWHY